MKVVILAGGLGTRISEESHLKPKPMIEIGDMPILWHIMKHYSHYDYNDFIICLGYKQYVVKEFFADYFLHTSDVEFDMVKNKMTVLRKSAEPWRVTLIDTGLDTMTGGRVRRIEPYVHGETFMLTYGDGVGDVNIDALLTYHRSHGKIGTLTAVDVAQRFGVLGIDKEQNVTCFREKSMVDNDRVNAGFMVFEPQIFDYIDGDSTVLEKEPLERLAHEGQLRAYPHNGFWKPMDTQREKVALEEMWKSGNAPWKTWRD
ncbi:MAG: glucose-1-phosphate cytidylyltransferase [Clostridia bacterium]|nr:glucose-1-phosphate cytidylyltransferase [Clostridia bacterium]